MLTGELRSKIDGVWNAFWAGGIANPLEVIEQITYLLFMRGLDEAHTREENKANRLGKPLERRIFPKGKDGIGKGGGVAYEEMRWSKLKNKDPATMFEIVSEHVFPFLRNMADADTAHATHMKGARFTIPTPALLAKVVDLLAEIPMEDRDTKGDLYEYMLSKIASAGQNGQFRTPRHIIALMVDMMAPGPKDVICDPACGTCGFLVAANEYLRDNHPRLFQEKASRDHFHEEMFHGFDFDGTMLRIGSMNMTLHGVDNPDIRYKDSLAQEHAGDEDRYSLVLANPPFAGSLDYETTAKDLLAIVKTKKTELLFMALFLKLLKPGGRAAVIVPDGVLFGSPKQPTRPSHLEMLQPFSIIDLDDFGVKASLQVLEELKAEEHPYFVGVGKSCGSSAGSQMIFAPLNYACPSGRGWCAEGGEAATSKFDFRCPRTCRRRCGGSVDRNSLNPPPHFIRDMID
jgi:type I restriction enzyme M protein